MPSEAAGAGPHSRKYVCDAWRKDGIDFFSFGGLFHLTLSSSFMHRRLVGKRCQAAGCADGSSQPCVHWCLDTELWWPLSA